MTYLDRHRSLWLALGAALLVASQLRFGIGVLAWIPPIPLLRYLRLASGPRAILAVMGTLLVAWSAAVAKIATAPVPIAMAPLFGVPIGLALALPYVVWARVRSRVGEARGVLLFASTSVLAEWTLHALLPFGTWGAAANTQLDRLALLQLASITGLHGVSFLVYAVSAALESLLDRREPARVRTALIALVGTSLIVAGGQARLAWASSVDEVTVRVATIDTDATFGGLPLPDEATVRAIDATLEERTREAARAGARLVVWPEAATLVRPEDEPAFLARVQALARDERVHVAAAYVVPSIGDTLPYENAYVMITPEGRVAHRYLKHHPVPGEPAVPGEGPMPVLDDETLGRMSGAICYDYDFPRLALEHAALSVDLVALPSSDWRGIDPLHTEMASLRAIEGGHTIVRATRFGRSAAYDAYGRLRASHDHFAVGPRVMIAEVPRRGIPTVYAWIGDAFVALCLAASLAMLALAWRSNER
jgi:apolipoprotein N-acyltransferase